MVKKRGTKSLLVATDQLFFLLSFLAALSALFSFRVLVALDLSFLGLPSGCFAMSFCIW